MEKCKRMMEVFNLLFAHYIANHKRLHCDVEKKRQTHIGSEIDVHRHTSTNKIQVLERRSLKNVECFLCHHILTFKLKYVYLHTATAMEVQWTRIYDNNVWKLNAQLNTLITKMKWSYTTMLELDCITNVSLCLNNRREMNLSIATMYGTWST